MAGKTDLNHSSSLNVVEGCLILTLPQEIDDVVFAQVKNELLNKITHEELKAVIIDFGSIKIMDSYEFNEFLKLIKMVGLLGVETALVGFQPGLVSALIDMKVDTDGLITFLKLSDGLEYFKNKFGATTNEEECEDGLENELEENVNEE